ncbi:hypothetical protein [Roseibium sp. Sym1]|uniref:hypothetical protein n=1 Tax=Roseibium sp. Sym1 TaxID=3016006 RepID=UPI0022B4862E|nr:hypothetical protein [Roseibium sp. Sym1]
MTDELLTSDHLELRQAAGFAVVSIRNTRFWVWLSAFCANLLVSVCLAWEIWQGFTLTGSNYSQIVAGALGIAAVLQTITWQRLSLSYRNACRVVVTKDFITIERIGPFGRTHQPLTSSAIDAVWLEPDTFSRPFHGYPYRRKNHHVCLRHAGEDLRLFRGLSHAEALTVAAAVLPGTSCLKLEDHATTPKVPALGNVIAIENNNVPSISAESRQYIHIARVSKGTVIALRPHFDLSFLALVLLVSVNVAILTTSFIRPDLDLDLAHMVFLSLMAALLVSIYLRFGFDAFRREIVTLSDDTIQHQTQKLLGQSSRRYQTACIRNVSITTTRDKVFVDTDFENKTIFQVCFDYGQTTRTVGYRMTYAEANYLRDVLTKSIKERRLAA